MLLLLAAALALVGMANSPDLAGHLLLVAGCDAVVAAVAFLVPWHRLRPGAPALLGLPCFAVLGLSTWSFGGVAAGTGPFLVLIYAWLAVHYRRRILLLYLAPALLAYVVPLVITHQSPLVLGSAAVLLPVALAVSLLIEAQARHLRDDRERLTRVEHWRSAMMNTLAHDVRTPLTTVQLALGEVRTTVSGPAARMLDSALRQTGRISRLADGLLDVSRIDSSGHLKLDRELLAARELVDEAASLLREGGVVNEVDGELRIRVDRLRFEQILVNLIGNALRYGAPPVVVTITRDGGADRLEIRDHGPGIPESLRPRLFTKFAVGGADGVGLGLWIVRALAEAHGGKVGAEARDPGVAMVVTFPAP